jgi:hypothetical protein
MQQDMRAERFYKVVKVKVTLSRYRPGEAVGVRESRGSRISRQSAHEGGKVVSPTHRPSLPPGILNVGACPIPVELFLQITCVPY